MVTVKKDQFKVKVGNILNGTSDYEDIELIGYLNDVKVSTSGVEPQTEIKVLCRIERANHGVIVHGLLRSMWDGECSRCLEPAKGNINVEFREVFATEPDLEIEYRLSGDHFDLTDLIKDQLILELPAVPVCNFGCRGLCPICGVNRNETKCNCKRINNSPFSVLNELSDPTR